MRGRLIQLVSIWLLLICAVFAGPAFGASLADLAGTWKFYNLITGPDAPWWGIATLTVNADGKFTGSLTASDPSDDSNSMSGSFSLSSGGFKLTGPGIDTNNLCQMDLDKTVLSCTSTSSKNTSASLIVGVKLADSYTTADDLPGNWEANMLDGGPSDSSWMRISNGTIDSSGDLEGSYSDSNSGVGNPSEKLALSGSGEVTLASCTTAPCLDANFDGYMDAGKSVMVGTYGVSNSTSDAVLSVFTKMAPSSSYSMNDLAGTWEGNFLASGPDAPWWQRLSGTIKANGTSKFSSTQNNGKAKTYTGLTWSISQDGAVTLSEAAVDQNQSMVMNSGKTVMVETASWSDGGTEIGIFTKTAGLPGAPAGVSATPGNAQAAVSFTQAAANGSPITTYTVTSSPDAAHLNGVTAKGTKSPITVKGLTNGTSYTFTITATNGVGPGPASNPASNSVTPGTKPAAPAIGVITVGVGQATVNFTEKSLGGSPTTYSVTSNPGGGVDGAVGTTSLSHLVTGLKSGEKYTFTVTATNAFGNSSSKSKSVQIK